MHVQPNIARILFFILGFFIAIGTLFYTSNLFNKLAKEESKEVALFAEALKSIGNPENTELNLYWHILQVNKNIPIIIFDEQDNLVQYKNIVFKKNEFKLTKDELIKKKDMNDKPIRIKIGKNTSQFIYYGYSPTLFQLRYIPIIQLILIILLIITGYIIYKSIQRANQNSLLAGLSKEAAHQLGTPISSLFAWVELLKSRDTTSEYAFEMYRDIHRLKIVTDRFSNIGSIPSKKKMNIIPFIKETIAYMDSRTSKNIKIKLNEVSNVVMAEVNKDLFVWVFESLIKNSVDAIVKKGKITITIEECLKNVYIDIKDTGKGISTNMTKKIFNPGYSTKKRGWGVGLSLAKRIIKDYHNGRIFVKKTEINHGTTFRIVIPKKHNTKKFYKKL